MSGFCGGFWWYLQRFWAATPTAVAESLAGLEVWVVLQEKDTILEVYDFLRKDYVR